LIDSLSVIIEGVIEGHAAISIAGWVLVPKVSQTGDDPVSIAANGISQNTVTTAPILGHWNGVTLLENAGRSFPIKQPALWGMASTLCEIPAPLRVRLPRSWGFLENSGAI